MSVTGAHVSRAVLAAQGPSGLRQLCARMRTDFKVVRGTKPDIVIWARFHGLKFVFFFHNILL